MFVKQVAGGKWYIFRKTKTKKNPNSHPTYRDWFFIRYMHNNKAGIAHFKKGILYCPEELAGKKVRLRIEIMEDNANAK